MSRDALRDKGKDIAARLGLDAPASLVPGLDDLLAEVVHGGVWGRPNLALADRAICTLAVLSVLQLLAPLKTMVGAALNLGLTPRNIVEVFVHVGLYAGFVTTETSAAVAQDVFLARGLAVSPEPRPTDSDEMLDRKGREVMAQLHGDRAQEGYAAPETPSRARSTRRRSATAMASSGPGQGLITGSACCAPSPHSRPWGLSPSFASSPSPPSTSAYPARR